MDHVVEYKVQYHDGEQRRVTVRYEGPTPPHHIGPWTVSTRHWLFEEVHLESRNLDSAMRAAVELSRFGRFVSEDLYG